MRDVRTLALAGAIGIGLFIGIGGATMVLRTANPDEVAAGSEESSATTLTASTTLTGTPRLDKDPSENVTTVPPTADRTSTDSTSTTGTSLVDTASTSEVSVPAAPPATIVPTTTRAPTTVAPTTTRAPTTTIAPTTTTSPDPFFDHTGRFFDIVVPSTYLLVERDVKKPYGWRTKFEDPLSGSYLIVDVGDGPELDPYDAATDVHDAVLSRNPTDVERTQIGSREAARFYLDSREGHAAADYFFNANGQPMAGLAVAIGEDFGAVENDLTGMLLSIG